VGSFHRYRVVRRILVSTEVAWILPAKSAVHRSGAEESQNSGIEMNLTVTQAYRQAILQQRDSVFTLRAITQEPSLEFSQRGAAVVQHQSSCKSRVYRAS
jgi:hypothetical protein